MKIVNRVSMMVWGMWAAVFAPACKPKPTDPPTEKVLTRTEMLAGFPEKRYSLVEILYENRAIPASRAQSLNFLVFRNDGTGRDGASSLEWAWLDSAQTRLKLHVMTLDGVRKDTVDVESLTPSELKLRYAYLNPPQAARIPHPYVYCYKAY
jgi:hypothetical protein